VLIEAIVLDVPDELLTQLGLEQFKFNGRESSLQTMLSAADAADLIKELKAAKGVSILSRPRILASNGVDGRLFIGSQDPNRTTYNYTIGLTPNITTDGTAVDLSLDGEIDPPGISSSTGQGEPAKQ
ncbi:MAG: polymerase, sigma-24 subunit, subfamily, partial [Pedosphaera sp.]|nr:polymerase, sigma-24 subunit, subfamily [Pedosphaera sp.]